MSELGHGWFNVAYRICLRDGSRVVLKIAPPVVVEVLTYERGAMATELAALRLIREHTGAADRDAYQDALGAANRELNAIRGPAFGPLAGRSISSSAPSMAQPRQTGEPAGRLRQ